MTKYYANNLTVTQLHYRTIANKPLAKPQKAQKLQKKEGLKMD